MKRKRRKMREGKMNLGDGTYKATYNLECVVSSKSVPLNIDPEE